jgi:hypothetical protein
MRAAVVDGQEVVLIGLHVDLSVDLVRGLGHVLVQVDLFG